MVPPFHLRYSSVEPPSYLRQAFGSRTEEERRCDGGTTEVSAFGAGGPVAKTRFGQGTLAETVPKVPVGDDERPCEPKLLRESPELRHRGGRSPWMWVLRQFRLWAYGGMPIADYERLPSRGMVRSATTNQLGSQGRSKRHPRHIPALWTGRLGSLALGTLPVHSRNKA